ncbi:MAG: carboxypeptidase regulatory-like domain-containing protein [Planctomycetes bacterium]|nr:carboxypeptidase regulatory-like domain-containing protein [Planctomycetota bacterium]
MSGEPKLRTIIALLVIAIGLGILTWRFTRGSRDGGGTNIAEPEAGPRASEPHEVQDPVPGPEPPKEAKTVIELVAPPEPPPKEPSEAESKAPAEAPAPAPPPPPEVDPGLAPGDAARVEVVDSAGAPIAGATILLAMSEGGAQVEERVGETGADGTLTFRRPADPGAGVRAIAPLHREASGTLEDGAARIVLSASVAIPVAIAGAPALPALDRVRLLDADGTLAGREGDWAPAAGGALLGCPGPGTYRIEVHAAGFAPAVSGPIEVKDGEKPPRVEVTLEAAARLRGRVTVPSGTNIGGADIEIRRIGEDPSPTIEVLGIRVADRRGDIAARIRTAADGTFIIDDALPAGTYRAWARARGFGEACSAPFEIPSVAEIAIALEPGGTIRGSVAAGTGDLAAAVRGDGLVRVAPIAPDGSFEIRDVPAGAYGVLVLPGAPAEAPASFPVEVRAGASVTWSAGAGAGEADDAPAGG